MHVVEIFYCVYEIAFSQNINRHALLYKSTDLKPPDCIHMDTPRILIAVENANAYWGTSQSIVW